MVLLWRFYQSPWLWVNCQHKVHDKYYIRWLSAIRSQHAIEVNHLFTQGTRGIFSRASGSFVSSTTGRRHERRSRAGHFLRLDRNRKPRMKSLWHPGQKNRYLLPKKKIFHFDVVSMSLSRPLFPEEEEGIQNPLHWKLSKPKDWYKLVKTVGISALRESFARNDGIEEQ